MGTDPTCLGVLVLLLHIGSGVEFVGVGTMESIGVDSALGGVFVEAIKFGEGGAMVVSGVLAPSDLTVLVIAFNTRVTPTFIAT